MSKDIGQILGETIARRRKKQDITQDITQEQLASMVHLSPRSIQRIENGKETPPYDRLFKIAKALDTTPNRFITAMWRAWNK